MKGIVFTELIEMVEEDLGIVIADRMISHSGTQHQGAYTAVGTYDHGELIRLVMSLSRETAIPVPDLVRVFGKHLFKRFVALYPQFFVGVDVAVSFLPLIESYIHVEVRKLYPDAELPTFECSECEGVLSMTYQSNGPFADLAEGLILACADHFGDPIRVEREERGLEDGTHAAFHLVPHSHPMHLPVEPACQK